MNGLDSQNDLRIEDGKAVHRAKGRVTAPGANPETISEPFKVELIPKLWRYA